MFEIIASAGVPTTMLSSLLLLFFYLRRCELGVAKPSIAAPRPKKDEALHQDWDEKFYRYSKPKPVISSFDVPMWVALYTTPSSGGGGIEPKGVYCRKMANWAKIGNEYKACVTFTVPGDTRIVAAGLHDAVGRYMDGLEVTAQRFDQQGTYMLYLTADETKMAHLIRMTQLELTPSK